MAAQRSSPHSPRAGCSLCTIITNLRSTATSSGSSESTPVDIQHAYRTPWATSLSPGPASPTPTTPHEQPSPTSPTAHAPLTSPSTSTSTSSRKVAGERRAIYTDSDLTVWPALSGRAGEALASGERHLVLAFNVHVESVYQLGRADVPLLTRALRIANDLLDKDPSGQTQTDPGLGTKAEERKIGFVVGPLRDPRHPYAHVHLHAVKGPWDLASYYRKAMVYNFVGWYELEDLIAEIR
ncbi:hypothetical protein FFLO_01980 [Filobasidium floriforme]|uniref:HIT domain-containing protein n=1 Tax=Filobasidium floriforme TaxID=5210 RepID=A0A8K0NUF5_9TREE|nr:hypothetical protein FFLO_01980 [Filobasidium floriforme]